MGISIASAQIIIVSVSYNNNTTLANQYQSCIIYEIHSPDSSQPQVVLLIIRIGGDDDEVLEMYLYQAQIGVIHCDL